MRKLFHRRREGGKDGADDSLKRVMPIVYACMNMARSRTGALIVIEQVMNLESYEKTGDMIDANINSRLIEHIFQEFTASRRGHDHCPRQDYGCRVYPACEP